MTGPLPAIASPVTVPASKVYGWVIAARNARFDRGTDVRSLDRPVISVGNLTTGGTGKTPMVAWIARALLENGLQPVIAMRGYMAAPGTPSDEQAEYATILPDVPVLANPDRIGALREFLPEHEEVRCVILDDGFQHRQLRRDLDLVLIDATSKALDDRLLPAGNLREPPGSLRRADAVIVTRAANIDDRLSARIQKHHGRPPLAWTRHAWTHLNMHQAGSSKREPIEWLRGKRLVTMLGVGNPSSIIRQVESAGAIVAADIPCSDHERYDRAKLSLARGLCSGCHALIVTGKDWVKIEKLLDSSGWPTAIVVPQLMIEVFEGESALRDRVMSAAHLRK